jgi:hypothetical protein
MLAPRPERKEETSRLHDERAESSANVESRAASVSWFAVAAKARRSVSGSEGHGSDRHGSGRQRPVGPSRRMTPERKECEVREAGSGFSKNHAKSAHSCPCLLIGPWSGVRSWGSRCATAGNCGSACGPISPGIGLGCLGTRYAIQHGIFSHKSTGKRPRPVLSSRGPSG